MSDLLTRDEYAAIAASLDFPRAAFIDGKYRAGNGDTLTTINPATGEPLCDIATCNSADVDFAVSKARETFDQGHWSKLHPSERKDVLIRLCKLLTRNARELAVMESLDSGKPIRDCVMIDLPETIHTIKWHAEAVDKMYDQVAPTGDDAMGLIVREPIGVVAAILPWNFPLLMLAWKIGPALAAGNSVIVKPAEQTSLTALRVAELAAEAGVPAVCCKCFLAMAHPLGSLWGCTMMLIWSASPAQQKPDGAFCVTPADSNLKKVVLECGGKNPAIVLEDAENLDSVAEHVVNAAFWNMGENCSAKFTAHRSARSKIPYWSALLPACGIENGRPARPAKSFGCID